MMLAMIIGLWPIVPTFILLGLFVARIATKRGKKSPWLWGGLAMVLVTALSWPHLFRWAGWAFAIQTAVVHKFHNPPPLPDPNKIDKFTLPAKGTVHIFSVPAAYRAEYFQNSPLIKLNCRYPTMEASPGSTLSEGVVNIRLALHNVRPGGPASRAQLFLDGVAFTATSKNKAFYRYSGKQGGYDIFQRQDPVTAKTDTTFLFTAKDGELVLVEPSVFGNSRFGHRVWRNISPGLRIDYSFWPVIGNDFIKIDEAVSGFIKAHLVSQPTQNMGATL